MGSKSHKLLLAFLIMGFMLGSYNGNLALWAGEDPEPIHTFQCRIDSLPPADQILLHRGILISNRMELIKILEDYL